MILAVAGVTWQLVSGPLTAFIFPKVPAPLPRRYCCNVSGTTLNFCGKVDADKVGVLCNKGSTDNDVACKESCNKFVGYCCGTLNDGTVTDKLVSLAACDPRHPEAIQPASLNPTHTFVQTCEPERVWCCGADKASSNTYWAGLCDTGQTEGKKFVDDKGKPVDYETGCNVQGYCCGSKNTDKKGKDKCEAGTYFVPHRGNVTDYTSACQDTGWCCESGNKDFKKAFYAIDTAVGLELWNDTDEGSDPACRTASDKPGNAALVMDASNKPRSADEACVEDKGYCCDGKSDAETTKAKCKDANYYYVPKGAAVKNFKDACNEFSWECAAKNVADRGPWDGLDFAGLTKPANLVDAGGKMQNFDKACKDKKDEVVCCPKIPAAGAKGRVSATGKCENTERKANKVERNADGSVNVDKSCAAKPAAEGSCCLIQQVQPALNPGNFNPGQNPGQNPGAGDEEEDPFGGVFGPSMPMTADLLAQKPGGAGQGGGGAGAAGAQECKEANNGKCDQGYKFLRGVSMADCPAKCEPRVVNQQNKPQNQQQNKPQNQQNKPQAQQNKPQGQQGDQKSGTTQRAGGGPGQQGGGGQQGGTQRGSGAGQQGGGSGQQGGGSGGQRTTGGSGTQGTTGGTTGTSGTTGGTSRSSSSSSRTSSSSSFTSSSRSSSSSSSRTSSGSSISSKSSSSSSRTSSGSSISSKSSSSYSSSSKTSSSYSSSSKTSSSYSSSSKTSSSYSSSSYSSSSRTSSYSSSSRTSYSSSSYSSSAISRLSFSSFYFSPPPPAISRSYASALSQFRFTSSRPAGYVPECGNGLLDFGEECDDSNNRNNDGCSAICAREIPSVPIVDNRPICGNGILEIGEECDDGNSRSGDDCSVFCTLEQGYCGDGIVQGELGEQCDGPLSVQGMPFSCGPDCRIVSRFCGDGKLDAGEECDDGPANSDARDAACRTNCSRQRCGDGILDAGEECDDGNLYAGDGCDRLCKKEVAPPPVLPATVITLPGQPGVPPSQVAPPRPGQPQLSDQGPAAIAVMAAGAAAGYAFMRRRRFR